MTVIVHVCEVCGRRINDAVWRAPDGVRRCKECHGKWETEQGAAS